MLQINGERFDQCINCGMSIATGVQQLSQLKHKRGCLRAHREKTLFRDERTIVAWRHYQRLNVYSVNRKMNINIRCTEDRWLPTTKRRLKRLISILAEMKSRKFGFSTWRIRRIRQECHWWSGETKIICAKFIKTFLRGGESAMWKYQFYFFLSRPR